jgi:hypothetical protein
MLEMSKRGTNIDLTDKDEKAISRAIKELGMTREEAIEMIMELKSAEN